MFKLTPIYDIQGILSRQTLSVVPASLIVSTSLGRGLVLTSLVPIYAATWGFFPTSLVKLLRFIFMMEGSGYKRRTKVNSIPSRHLNRT